MKLRKRGYTGTTSTAVTEREITNGKVARKAAREGFVLLKNDGLLPFAKGAKLGVYGGGAIKTIKGGTGSGDVNERKSVSIYEGLINGGFQVTSAEWLEDYEKVYDQARIDWRDEIVEKAKVDPVWGFWSAYSTTQFNVPSGNLIDTAKAKADGADTAVFVLSRIAGENADRFTTPGDYYISEGEKAILAQVSECYENILLVINTGGLVDLGFVDEFPKIKSIIQFMQAGQEGGNALADVLCGAVTPSGKLTDTWPAKYEDLPNASTFSHQNGNVMKEEYTEGIYVGYRYFDTFGVKPLYSFGYGLSYTTFDIKTDGISISGQGTTDPHVNVQLTVTNTGSQYSGKEVAQVYVSCPQGKLAKEFRRLAGFGKTKLLAPGESQTMTISFPLYSLTSFCEECSSYILESGNYGVWVGGSLEGAQLGATFSLNETVQMVKLGHICPLEQPLEEISPCPHCLAERENEWNVKAQMEDLPKAYIKADEIVTQAVEYRTRPAPLQGAAGEIVNEMTVDQLVSLASGDPARDQSALGSAGQTVPGAAAETVATDKVASLVLADGPAGIRLRQVYQVLEDGSRYGGSFLEALEKGFFAPPAQDVGTKYYQYCTSVPVGTLLAQTWDTELLKEVGAMVGSEMNLFEVTLWLAPGMNIHRNPLCGRNFEYYSEDPLLAGMMAGAITLGVQSVPGVGTTIKHYACNNQEDNRTGSDTIVSERALREIYLKGFEIAVKNTQPMSIMTSYNMINGVHTANSYDLCTKAARDEWGFAGTIMTDWTTTTNSAAGRCSAAGCMLAGNDMVMPGAPEDHETIRAALADGTLSLEQLKRCIYNNVNIALQSNQYEDAVSYSAQFAGLDTYMTCK